MTTLQEAQTMALIDAYADAVADYVASDYCMAGDNSNLGERAKEARAAVVAALAQQGEQQPVCHGCGIPAGDMHMSTCKSGKWPSRVSNGDTAAPAPQQVERQGEQAKPAAYITDTEQGPMVWTPEMYGEACTYCDDGEFPVPLYTAAHGIGEAK